VIRGTTQFQWFQWFLPKVHDSFLRIVHEPDAGSIGTIGPMRIQRSAHVLLSAVLSAGLVLTLASCASNSRGDSKTKVADSTRPAGSSELSDSLELSSEAPVSPESGNDTLSTETTESTESSTESNSQRIAAVLAELGARPGDFGTSDISGTGPCPLFVGSGAEPAKEWAVELDPPAVFCVIGETASVAVVEADAFSFVADEVKQGDGVREFPDVAFEDGMIKSICGPDECFTVWNDGVVGVARVSKGQDKGGAKDHEADVAWIKANLRTVLERGANLDLSKVRFPIESEPSGPSSDNASGEPAAAAETSVEASEGGTVIDAVETAAP
jgi:hypothetical protein